MAIRHDDALAGYIIEAGVGVRPAEPFIGLVLTNNDGTAAGACVFNVWTGRDVHVSSVLYRKMTTGEVRYLARYVFGKLGCARCTATTPTRHAKARTALQKLGFKIEGVLRQYYPDDDAAVYGLLRAEQRIVRPK